MQIKMMLLPLLLVVSPTICSPAAPFYCRRFKGNCSVRRESICCREENIPEPAAVKPAVVKEPVEIIDTEHNLLASSSIINEVVVVADEPSTRDSLISITTTTVKPGRPVPRFCKLLKFDCKKRSNPLCCKDSPQELVQEKIDLKEQHTKDETKVKPTENVKGFKNSITNDNYNNETVNTTKSSSEVFLGRTLSKPNKPKNKFGSARSSFFSKRPNLKSSGKSSLCKIINCEKVRNKKHKCCQEEETENLEKEIEEEKTELIIHIEDITDEDDDNIRLEEPLDIKKLQNNSNEKDDSSSKEISTTTEHKPTDMQILLNPEVVDKFTVSEDLKTTTEKNVESTELIEVSSLTSVTETIDIEISTNQQEIKDSGGIKIKNETSLFDSIMNQLLSFNISSFNTFDETLTTKSTEAYSKEETLGENPLTEDYDDATTSAKDIDLEDPHDTTTIKPEEATTVNLLKEDVGVNNTGITSLFKASDTTEETVTGSETTEENLSMETTNPDEQMILTSFSINNHSKVSQLFSTSKINTLSLPNIGESENHPLADIGDENNIKDGTNFIDQKFDLLEAGSSNSVYIDTKAPNKESSYVGNLITQSPGKDDSKSTLVSDGDSPAPYTVISLPGYSNLRQPFVLQYPGMVTATITRVSKSYSWL